MNTNSVVLIKVTDYKANNKVIETKKMTLSMHIVKALF